MTGMDFIKAFEWARKHPSAYGRFAATEGEAEPDKQMEETPDEQSADGTNGQTSEERN